LDFPASTGQTKMREHDAEVSQNGSTPILVFGFGGSGLHGIEASFGFRNALTVTNDGGVNLALDPFE
jgi:hypothetical protein